MDSEIPEDQRTAVEHGDMLVRMLEPILSTLQPHDDVSVLYHYTDASGLRGIVDSNSLFATHFLCLNDPSELKYGASVLLDVLGNTRVPDPLGPCADVARRVLQGSVASNSVFEAMPHTFIACFCANGDLLSQWRAYAADATGYSIGIRHRELEDNLSLFPMGGGDPGLFKVIYNHDEQIRIAQQGVDCWVDGCSHIMANGQIESLAATSVLVALLFLLSAVFKHQCFNEEQEYRLIYQLPYGHGGTDKVKVRESRGRLVPYVALPVDSHCRLPLDGIVRGPRHASRRSAHQSDVGLYWLLQTRGFESPESLVTLSAIPFV